MTNELKVLNNVNKIISALKDINPSSVTGGWVGVGGGNLAPFKDVKFPQKLFSRNAPYESSVNKYYFKGYLGIFGYSCISLNGLYRGFYSIYCQTQMNGAT